MSDPQAILPHADRLDSARASGLLGLETQMTISDVICARWGDLSHRAQEHIRATRAHLLREWSVSEEGYGFATVEADDLEAAIDAAKDEVDTSCYGERDETIWCDYCVRNDVTGEYGTFSLQIDPDEPDCAAGHEHDWRTPHSVLGGLRENPGVVGHGGGVICREVCLHCGRYQVTDTWAQNRSNGTQGLTSVTYKDADEESLAWVRRSKLRQVIDNLSDTYLDITSDGDDAIRVNLGPIEADEAERDVADIIGRVGDGYTVDWSRPHDDDDDVVVSVQIA